MYEPVNRDNVLEGAKLAFGQPVETRYDFEKADVIVSLDADFLYAGFPGNVRYIRDFAKRRNPDRQDEPAVCDREHADDDGGEGGSSAADAELARSREFARRYLQTWSATAPTERRCPVSSATVSRMRC